MRDALAITRFADLYKNDQEAKDAARQAAIDAKEPQPQGLMETLAANHMAAKGQSWANTPRGRQRFQEAMAEQALKGATAYVQGVRGNAYTRFLAKRYGGNAETRASSPFPEDSFLGAVWRDYWKEPPLVRYVVAALFLACFGFSLFRAISLGDWFMIILSPVAGVIFGFFLSLVTVCLLLCILGFVVTARGPGLGVWARELPGKLREVGEGLLFGGAFGLVIGLLFSGGMAWQGSLAGWDVLKPPIVWSLFGMFLVGILVLSVVVLVPLFEEGHRFLSIKSETVDDAATPAPMEATPGPSLLGASTAAAMIEMPAPGPSPGTRADWLGGGLSGDRLGLKQFRTVLHTDLAPLDILSHVSRTLTQLGSVQPWRVVPTVKTSGQDDEEAISFAANGSYSWDSSPYVTQGEEGRVLVQDISGQSRSGSGTVHLECSVVPCEPDDRVELVLQFNEASYPMWMRRQAEAYVACTLREVTQVLRGTLGADLTWEFRLGDWLTYQLLSYGGESLELRSARSQ